jgi:shikimate kinase
VTLVLIGPPAAGKSRVGKALARRLEIPYIDTDSVIVREHGAIAEIFAEHGEPHFRALERAAVSKALREHAVVSLGGGAVLDPDTQRDLEDKLVVLLTVRADAVTARIGGGKRPLVSDIDSWQRLADARADLYASLASFTTDTSHRAVDSIVDEIADWVTQAGPQVDTGQADGRQSKGRS